MSTHASTQKNAGTDVVAQRDDSLIQFWDCAVTLNNTTGYTLQLINAQTDIGPYMSWDIYPPTYIAPATILESALKTHFWGTSVVLGSQGQVTYRILDNTENYPNTVTFEWGPLGINADTAGKTILANRGTVKGAGYSVGVRPLTAQGTTLPWYFSLYSVCLA